MTTITEREHGIAAMGSAGETESAELPIARGPREPQKRDKPTKHSRKRRSLSIRFYAGPNGAGKTVTAVRDLLPSMDRGRPILSTVPIVHPETGELYRNYIPFESWAPILDEKFKHYDILMDEVTGIANARDSGSLPRAVQAELEKLRKRDVTVSMTAPAFARVDVTLRGVALGVVLCAGYIPARDKNGDTSGDIAAWKPKRLIRVRTFDAKNYEAFDAARTEQTAQKHRRLRPLDVEWWWGPKSRAFAAYDSFGAVSRVGEILDGGRCARCGGTRAIPKCSCGDEAAPSFAWAPNGVPTIALSDSSVR
jgi:hypothetical protein